MEESHNRQYSYSNSQHLLKQTVYQCPMCDRLTMSLKVLVNHLTKHKLQCSTESASKNSAHHHPQHLCSECGKQFAVAAVLASHVRIVHRGQFSFVTDNTILFLNIYENYSYIWPLYVTFCHCYNKLWWCEKPHFIFHVISQQLRQIQFD